MTRPRWRARTVLLITLGAALAAGSLLTAAAVLSPRTEEMKAGGVSVKGSYTPAATADDLDLPFYPGAELADSFLYRVTAPGDRRVLLYASAILLTPDSPQKVAAHYHDTLPGHPEPETLQGEQAERIVLALSKGDEVRTVTITAADGGSRIELLRASTPAIPPKPFRPRGKERVT
ncbi:MAG: hypothetical protein ACE149_17675 [Armatimonadota bacterium]